MRPASRVAAAAAVALTAAIALRQSWMRWLDPIIDIGRDLYIPEQILRGVRLYRDVRYYYPPAAPYLLACITRLIGHSLASYTAIGIGQSLAVALLLWMIARRVAGEWAAFTAAFLFVAFSMTGASTFGTNFIFPYSHAATLGMVAFLGFLLAVVYERPVIAVMLACLAASFKIEFAGAVALLVIVLFIAGRLRARHVALCAAVFAAGVACCIAYFGRGVFVANVLPHALLTGERVKHFYSIMSGASEWRDSIAGSARGLLFLIAGVVLLRTRWRIALLVVPALSLLIEPYEFFRAFAPVEWLLLCWALARQRRELAAVLAAFAVASTMRIPFNVVPAWYGFVFIIPVYVLIVWCLFEWLPSLNVYPRQYALAWVAAIALFGAREVMNQRERYALKRYPVATSRGTFYDSNQARARILNAALPKIRGSLAVFPEGVTLNYFARVPTTLQHIIFTPVETASSAEEEAILREMDAHPPEMVALVKRDVREFGYLGFGADYDQRLYARIARDYRVDWAEINPDFFCVLMRRR